MAGRHVSRCRHGQALRNRNPGVWEGSVMLTVSVFLYEFGLLMFGHTGFLNRCIPSFSVLVLISLWFLVEDLLALGI